MNEFFVKDGKWYPTSNNTQITDVIHKDDKTFDIWSDRVICDSNIIVSTKQGGSLFNTYGIYVTVYVDTENNFFLVDYTWEYDAFQFIYTDNINDAMELYFKLSKDVYSKLKLAYIENPCEIDVVKKDNMETTEYNYKMLKKIEAEERAELKRKRLEEKRLSNQNNIS